MLSEPPSPLPLRLPSPPPSPESESKSDYSSKSDYYVPSVKKQKVNSESDLEDGESSELEPPLTLTDDEIYIEDKFYEEELMIKDTASWERYLQQIRQSEGFDIKDYPGSIPWTTIFPMPDHLEDHANVERLKGYASKALEQYNEKHATKYEVDEILKVNGDEMQDLYFYITLSVKNGEYHYFQVKVVERINNSLDFPVVRPRVKGGLDI